MSSSWSHIGEQWGRRKRKNDFEETTVAGQISRESEINVQGPSRTNCRGISPAEAELYFHTRPCGTLLVVVGAFALLLSTARFFQSATSVDLAVGLAVVRGSALGSARAFVHKFTNCADIRVPVGGGGGAARGWQRAAGCGCLPCRMVGARGCGRALLVVGVGGL